jgi:hypothetical protein
MTHARGAIGISSTAIIWILVVVVVVVGGALAGYLALRPRVRTYGPEQVRALRDETRAAGFPVSAAELEPPDVPKNENAWLVYRAASERLTELPQEVKDAAARLETLGPEHWSSGDVDVVRRYVNGNASALRLARKAAPMPRFKSETNWADHINAKLTHLAPLHNLGRLMNYNACVELADGRLDDAIESCTDAMRIGRHASAEPCITGRMVEISVRATALRILACILTQTKDAEQAGRVLAAVEKLYPERRMREMLAAERAMGISFFGDVRAGKMSLDDPYGGTGAPQQYPPVVYDTNEGTYLDLMEGYIELADKPYYEVADRMAMLERRSTRISPLATVAYTMIPGYANICRQDAGDRALTDVVRCAAAVKVYELRTDRLPDALTDLVPDPLPKAPVDEFSGETLRYEKRGDGFVVYSVGQNQIDDGGVESTDNQSGDIVYKEP